MFQMDDSNNPRAVSYPLKTWESRFQDYIPAFKELLGLISALKQCKTAYEHGQYRLKVFVDSLPLVLCTISARFKRKVARYK